MPQAFAAVRLACHERCTAATAEKLAGHRLALPDGLAEGLTSVRSQTENCREETRFQQARRHRFDLVCSSSRVDAFDRRSPQCEVARV